jgi:hypothetical protein
MRPPAAPLIQTAPHGVALSVSHLQFHTCKSKTVNKVIDMKHNVIIKSILEGTGGNILVFLWWA